MTLKITIIRYLTIGTRRFTNHIASALGAQKMNEKFFRPFRRRPVVQITRIIKTHPGQ
jgi:hypothetical protein